MCCCIVLCCSGTAALHRCSTLHCLIWKDHYCLHVLVPRPHARWIIGYCTSHKLLLSMLPQLLQECAGVCRCSVRAMAFQAIACVRSACHAGHVADALYHAAVDSTWRACQMGPSPESGKQPISGAFVHTSTGPANDRTMCATGRQRVCDWGGAIGHVYKLSYGSSGPCWLCADPAQGGTTGH